MGAYQKKQADFVVVGSGPGGATAALELARAGKKVVLLEQGKDHRGKWYYGTHLGCMLYCARGGFLMTQEGLRIVCGTMTGGSTNLFCGCASPPPPWLKKRYRVDLDADVQATFQELGLAPLPRSLWGRATQRVEEAAGELGYRWEPQAKFMNVSRGLPFDCGGKCMLGCRCGAKWTANEYVDEAVRLGCELITGARVKEVTVSNGAAVGVLATLAGRSGLVRVEAGTVILSAGGLGTPMILQHSGVPEAGRGLTMDTTSIVYGESREDGMGQDPPMAISWCDDDNGYMLSTLMEPWMLFDVNLALKGPRNPLRMLRYGRTMGLMIKLKDEISGGISMEGKISKSLTEQDRWRLNHAANLCRQILVRAGCRPESIFLSPQIGTHPSGTVRIGELLTTKLESPIRNLYVSDASCFPESLDRPTVVTLIALSKRLVRHLLARGQADNQTKTKAGARTRAEPKSRKAPQARAPEEPGATPQAEPPAEAPEKP